MMSLPSLHRPASIFIVLAGAAIYLFAGGFYVERGEISADEGFYAYASYAVMHGRIPYRDFAYTQTPLLPYLQGAIMSFTGFGVRQQRWINVGLGALAVAAGAALWRKARLHPVVCWTLILAWCLCKPLLYYDSIGKTYAMSGLLLVAAGACLCLDIPPWTKLGVLSLLGVLAIGCRLTMAPAVFVLWCGLMAKHRAQLSWVLLLGVPTLTLLILLGPFYIADPSNFLFWNWTYHQLSRVPTDRLHVLLDSVVMAPAITLLILAGVSLLGFKRAKLRSPGACLFLAGLVGWLSSVGSIGAYAEYAVPCLPLSLTGGGLLLCDLPIARRLLSWGCPLFLLVAATSLFFGENFIVKGYLEEVDRCAAYIDRTTGPADAILTSMPEIPLQSHRPIFPALELGKFSLTNERDDATAEKLHMITFDQLLEAVDRQSAPVIVLSHRHNWNFGWSIPSLRPFSQNFYRRFSALLLRRYDCVYINDLFLVFKIHDPQVRPLKLDINNM